MLIMTRTQIQLTETQIQRLRRLSAEQGVSMADLVRQSVDKFLAIERFPDRNRQIERALKVAGKFSSGSSDGSTKHDAYLAEAFES